MIRIDGNKLYLKNNQAGCMWLFALVLLGPFLPALYWMWTTTPHPPMLFLIPFTLVFIIAGPMIGYNLLRRQNMELMFDHQEGVLHVKKRGIFKSSREIIAYDRIRRIEIKESDNDGVFYDVSLSAAGHDRIPVIHGNYRTGVLAKTDELFDFLRTEIPDIQKVEFRA